MKHDASEQVPFYTSEQDKRDAIEEAEQRGEYCTGSGQASVGVCASADFSAQPSPVHSRVHKGPILSIVP